MCCVCINHSYKKDGIVILVSPQFKQGFSIQRGLSFPQCLLKHPWALQVIGDPNPAITSTLKWKRY